MSGTPSTISFLAGVNAREESWMAGTGPATRLGYSDASGVVASAPPAGRTVPVVAADRAAIGDAPLLGDRCQPTP